MACIKVLSKEIMTNLQIRSREQLLAALGEASEIEHNLMCCYLYALFSLKERPDEDILPEELAAVNRWRGIIRGIALEEMSHLTLVANLTSALGATPHLLRPNFPVNAGLYPSGVVIELAPFCMDTLDHFIFLERPVQAGVKDAPTFRTQAYSRGISEPRLMPFGSDYDTVGELYESIREGIKQLANELGESALFCGPANLQIGAADSALPGLQQIYDLASANAALDTIVIQGEGSTDSKDCHFSRFQQIKTEYLALLKQREFAPARPVARNPVMRPPINTSERLHITAEPAASLIDLANATYVQMLRVLQQLYSEPMRSAESKKALLGSSYQLMRAMATLGRALTQLPACLSAEGITAGMSFATVRMLTPYHPGDVELTGLRERIDGLTSALSRLHSAGLDLSEAIGFLNAATNLLGRPATIKLERTITALATPIAVSLGEKELANEPSVVEHAEGAAIAIDFEGKKCIHSRHCVLELPQVFKANTPGQWIDPDATPVEKLVAVAEKCPSGAIRYSRKDGNPDEQAPLVNTVNIRESGPLAIRGPLSINGKDIGFRATLCRCGKSNNKPFCDGSHVGAFVASGEPLSGDVTALEQRDGPISISPQINGPLEISGNLEICAGTGRTVTRVTQAMLCRCGHSKNKPFCDGSHAVVGFIAE
jgi:CDGSH-type Zn-finger protein/uncharacterized Fe-S cluster protein YjdI